MPLTPLHLGPVLLVAFLFFNDVDVTAAAVAAVVNDVGPLLVVLGVMNGPLHGPFHTVIGAVLLAVVTASILFSCKPRINEYLKRWSVDQERDYRMLLTGALLGTLLQVFLDSFVHGEMHPFFPVMGNPLHGTIPGTVVFWFTVACFPVAYWVYTRL